MRHVVVIGLVRQTFGEFAVEVEADDEGQAVELAAAFIERNQENMELFGRAGSWSDESSIALDKDQTGQPLVELADKDREPDLRL